MPLLLGLLRYSNQLLRFSVVEVYRIDNLLKPAHSKIVGSLVKLVAISVSVLSGIAKSCIGSSLLLLVDSCPPKGHLIHQ